MKQKLFKFLLRGGVLLAGSAILSKFLSLIRDRLLLEIFVDKTTVDLIYASFRIPDFFFWLLVASTVALTFIPRIQKVKEEYQKEFFSSFFWWITALMTGIVMARQLFLPNLVGIFAGGFDAEIQSQIVFLTRFLFGCVRFLSFSSAFSAFLQWKRAFWAMALAPLLYMGTIVLGIWLFAAEYGLVAVGVSAIAGAALHTLLLSSVTIIKYKLKIQRTWRSPALAFDNFTGDFGRRVLNGSAFQINQSADILIASFLIAGSVTAFSLGTALGHVLLSIVAFPIAQTTFPRLVEKQDQIKDQKAILARSTKIILLLTIPFSIICVILSEWILGLVFGLEGDRLMMTNTVFFWTVISLPAACLIPVWSRFFLANNDTTTPLKCNFIALGIATALAAFLSLQVFSGTQAILGLAIGNFTANFLNALLFGVLIWRTKSSPNPSFDKEGGT